MGKSGLSNRCFHIATTVVDIGAAIYAVRGALAVTFADTAMCAAIGHTMFVAMGAA